MSAPLQQPSSGAKARRTLTIPYITSWSAEERPTDRLVSRSRLGGIAYADELPQDRDSHGVLWRRSTLSPSRGRPELGTVHTARQRRAMRRLLCQVCAGPADRTDQGYLWLLGDDRDDWQHWPEHMGATHPPLCLPCAAASVGLCPYLRRSHVAVRVRDPRPAGVYGIVYRLGPRGPEPFAFDTVQFDDARLPWVLAAQLVMRLHGCSLVDLNAEIATAGLLRKPTAPPQTSTA